MFPPFSSITAWDFLDPPRLPDHSFSYFYMLGRLVTQHSLNRQLFFLVGTTSRQPILHFAAFCSSIVFFPSFFPSFPFHSLHKWFHALIYPYQPSRGLRGRAFPTKVCLPRRPLAYLSCLHMRLGVRESRERGGLFGHPKPNPRAMGRRSHLPLPGEWFALQSLLKGSAV